MRDWLTSLTRARGFNADGRAMGLALAKAMDEQRKDAARGVEEYLRTAAATPRRATV